MVPGATGRSGARRGDRGRGETLTGGRSEPDCRLGQLRARQSNTYPPPRRTLGTCILAPAVETDEGAIHTMNGGTMNGGPPIVAQGLGHRYRRRSPGALRGVDLEIPAGSIVALVGPNGAGKSTFIRLCLGFEVPDEGTVRVFGWTPHRDRTRAVGAIGYVPQSISLWRGLTVDEHFSLARAARPSFDVAYARRLVGSVGIEPRAVVQELSGGQQAQVALALALASRAPLLLLDEPLAGLDPLARRDFLVMLREHTRREGESWAPVDGASAESCLGPMRAWNELMIAEGDKFVAIMALLPFVAGLLAAGPIVARECEDGTARLAWWLYPSRRRWLLAEIGPVLALVLPATAVAAVVATQIADLRALGLGLPAAPERRFTVRSPWHGRLPPSGSASWSGPSSSGWCLLSSSVRCSAGPSPSPSGRSRTDGC